MFNTLASRVENSAQVLSCLLKFVYGFAYMSEDLSFPLIMPELLIKAREYKHFGAQFTTVIYK
jgi:hypothetical protein